MTLAIPTNAGLAALAAAIDPTDPVPITVSEMVIGDGNGAPITPLQTMTGLVNLRATKPITNVIRSGNQATFEAVFDENVGPFTIREAGLLDNNGVMLAVASIPATEKQTTAGNAYDILTLGLGLVVSSTAQITLLPPPGSQVSIANQLRAPWLTVNGARTTPPGSPADGDTYRVQAGASGGFSGKAHALAQWQGSAWVFKDVPETSLISEADTGRIYARTASGWAERFLPKFKITPARLLQYGCF
jgi:hypothetical protein